MIKLKVSKSKDNNKKELTLKKGSSLEEITKEFNLNEKVFFGKYNDKLVSLEEGLEYDGELKFITNPKSNSLWKESNKIAIEVVFDVLKALDFGYEIVDSYVDENGFSLDFKTNKNISETQINLIEGKAKKLFFTFKSNSPLKSKEIKFIKINGVSGITNKNDDSIINRIFGFVTVSQEVFDEKLLEIEERHSRDHRKIGTSLKLFYIDEEIGKGLPIWLPNGLILKNIIKNYISTLLKFHEYNEVETPIISSTNLFKISGHLDHYKDNMFPIMENQEKESMILRPMSCPFHIMVYKLEQRSYNDLPYRISEFVKQYRYEFSGSLIGLERVRAMELTDGHIFVTPDQIENEISNVYKLIVEALNKFNVEISYVELALHDPSNKQKYHQNTIMWEKSEKALKSFLDTNNIKYKELTGEAAFYGPKIDIQIKTSLGHIVTISTIQLDFLLPEKFNVSYIDKNNQKSTPILIHRGIIGTFERFISILLEQTKGNLPFWLVPEQIVVIPVNINIHLEYADKINKVLKLNFYRSKLDLRNERISLKIRESQIKKINIQIIIGDEEIKNQTISFRHSGEEKTITLNQNEFLKYLEKLSNV